MSIIITGATGNLGRLIIDGLLERVDARQVTAVVRNPDKAVDLAARGVQIAVADYDNPASFEGIFSADDKVLLISSSEFHKDRVSQHQAVLNAAQAANVKLLAYTSASGSLTGLITADHRATEAAIEESGLPYVFLRNGWYNENFTERLAPVLHYGAVTQAAGEGRVASASRADYAAAAVEVLIGETQENTAYELNGDTAWSFDEYASELSEQTGKTISYKSVPTEEYINILTGPHGGVPAPMATILAGVETSIRNGEMAEPNGILARLIGRPTTPIAQSITAAIS